MTIRQKLGKISRAGAGLFETIKLSLGGPNCIRVTKGRGEGFCEVLIGSARLNLASGEIDERGGLLTSIPTLIGDSLAKLGHVIPIIGVRIVVEDESEVSEKFLVLGVVPREWLGFCQLLRTMRGFCYCHRSNRSRSRNRSWCWWLGCEGKVLDVAVANPEVLPY